MKDQIKPRDESSRTILFLGLVGLGLVSGLILVGVGFGAATATDVVSEPSQTCSSGEGVSEQSLNNSVATYIDTQLQRQREQLNLLANRSDNFSAESLSISASVQSVESTNFSSLYNVTVRIDGTVPSRTGGTESVTQHQSVYISCDGNYVFQEPTKLGSESNAGIAADGS